MPARRCLAYGLTRLHTHKRKIVATRHAFESHNHISIADKNATKKSANKRVKKTKARNREPSAWFPFRIWKWLPKWRIFQPLGPKRIDDKDVDYSSKIMQYLSSSSPRLFRIITALISRLGLNHVPSFVRATPGRQIDRGFHFTYIWDVKKASEC